MPKKAVALYLILALIGAALFIFFTFPRTKDEIPTSNNQRPFPSAPGPNNVPVPETPPHPTAPPVPHGPSLRVMAWATPAEAESLSARLDAYAANTGQIASLTAIQDLPTYRHELVQALASTTPPDLCLVEARDFSGAEPKKSFLDVTPVAGAPSRGLAALSLGNELKALPTEFSADVLYYNPAIFNQAGIAYPGAHWNWDVLEAISRAIASLKLKTSAGDPVYALEAPADFDFWNMLCTQAGHPALDCGVWHLADTDSKDAEMRSLDFIHTFFQELTVAAPLPAAGAPSGHYFARQQAALLIGSSDLAATLPKFDYQMTVLPRDMSSASLARVNGWAVVTTTAQADSARQLVAFLAQAPIHAGWSGMQPPGSTTGRQAVCWQALNESVIPRLDPKDAPLAQFLDEQIGQWARQPRGDSGQFYARIQAEYQSGLAPQQIEGILPKPAEKLKPRAPTTELRDL